MRPRKSLVSLVASMAFGTAAALFSEERIDTAALGGLGMAWVTSVDAGYGVYTVAGLGDVDGDGFDDVGIGIQEPVTDLVLLRGPVFYLVYGRPRISGEVALEPTLERSWQLRAASSEPPVDWWGSVLAGSWGRAVHDAASAGDLNGDGFGDFLLGFGLYPDHGYPSSGVALLVRGGRHLQGAAQFEDLLFDPETTVFRSSDPLHQQIGVRCRLAGDFDGDGHQDFLVSAPASRLGSALDLGQGAAFVVFGGPDLPREVDLALVGTELRGVRIEGFEEFREGLGRVDGLDLGEEAASLGDFDGDGLSDVALLATSRWPRATYIVLGQREPPPVIRLIDAPSYPNVIEIRGHLQGSNSWFGHDGQAAALGDVNGDGRADLALARAVQCCPFLHPANSFVQVFFGSPDFPRHVDFEALDPGLGVMLEPAVENTLFGRYISPAGDFDGDGRPDLLVGAPYANPDGRSNAGEAYVLLSRSGFAEPTAMRGSFPGVRILGERLYETLGSDVAAAGDFDGDGFDDVLAVSRLATWERVRGTYPGANRVYTIYGGPRSGVPLDLLHVRPPFGPAMGGRKVRLVGTGFEPGIQVSFAGAAAAEIAILSSTELEATIPPGSEGLVDVRVSVGAETRTLPRSFFYSPLLPADLDALGPRGFTIQGREDMDLGIMVSSGDFNGDGFDDLLVSALPALWVLDQGGEGHAVIVWGSRASGDVQAFEPSARVTVVRPPWHAQRPFVSSPGDVDGDGFDDFVLALEDGHGHLVRGAREWPREVNVRDLFLEGRVTEMRAPDHGAFRVMGLGDLTGDGIHDFALPLNRASTIDPESEILFIEGRRRWEPDIDLPSGASGRILGGAAATDLGWQLEAVGDVNGDGLGDLLANSEPGLRQTAYLILGDPALFRGETELAAILQGSRARSFLLVSHDGFGLDISGAGDVNGDGYSDFLLGMPQWVEINRGRSYLVFGSPEIESLEIADGADPPAGVTAILGDRSPHQHAHVAPCGDLNGDGFDDFSVTARLGIPPRSGYVYVLFGKQTFPRDIVLGTMGLEAVRIEGILSLSAVDEYTNAVGDFNGDGVEDLVFRERGHPAEPAHDLPAEHARVYVVFGEPARLPFVRGDGNGDGIVNLTDPIALLDRLFQGAPRLPCDDAADADDSAVLDLTDAVYALNHLFLGGFPPLPPFPEPGPDPTPDDLGCRGF